jgi:hypothetical protein
LALRVLGVVSSIPKQEPPAAAPKQKAPRQKRQTQPRRQEMPFGVPRISN